ncbi:alcohol dehydrogenase [Fusarium beomiforme]|uniref:Alcohol dehydrogenase n=1 Tax=Fusarium beomiforme TaxID=44412 RepID=A0A9P5ABM7_9HYPO|nr:alcohol dehydrogenase [Fusarium beomiforme]
MALWSLEWAWAPWGLTRPTYGAVPSEDEILTCLDRAFEAGATFCDSAGQISKAGCIREIIGKWFKRTGGRNGIFIATKFGYVKNSLTLDINTSYEYTKQAYYLHIPDPNTLIEETMRALKELQDEGKIKYIGLSYIGDSIFELYCKVKKGTHILNTYRELGVTVVAAIPLGRGLLTTNFIEETVPGQQDNDIRYQLIPRFICENREKNIQLVSQSKELADKKGITTAQLAIAWLLKQGDEVIPIPGTKKIKYFEDNWAALEIALSDEEEAEIRSFVEKADVAGVPLPRVLYGWMLRDTKEETS